MKVKISSVNTSLTSTFQIKMSSEGTIKLIAYNSTLMSLLISVQKEDLKNDPDQLENFMLMLPKIRVEYTKGDNVASKITAM